MGRFSSGDDSDMEVETPHSFTGRMCAGSRWEESGRPDKLFEDPTAYALAGSSGRRQPMGAWILVPRTKFGDDLLIDRYHNHGARQLVLLGAGMDSRAYRMEGLEDLTVFEVDQQTTFDVKEPILEKPQLDGYSGNPAKVWPMLFKKREVVATEFSEKNKWVQDLVSKGFDKTVPTVWLLEGLMMYLSPNDGKALMRQIGSLSAPKSVVFHDGCSRSYLAQKIIVGGAPFIGGSDTYGSEWTMMGGFDSVKVHDFSEDLHVDRRNKRLVLTAEGRATPDRCKGRLLVLFVVAEKTK
ncbi:unnamed protein product [Amoebophrya sp. A120]|nr:unnamed protein product [Amoebophrya sp. A120]|eukprot:GSA120T00016856001.1